MCEDIEKRMEEVIDRKLNELRPCEILLWGYVSGFMHAVGLLNAYLEGLMEDAKKKIEEVERKQEREQSGGNDEQGFKLGS